MMLHWEKMGLLDDIRNGVRAAGRQLAVALNRATHSKLTPNMVTTVGVAMHLPIGLLIAYGKLELAAGLLIVFGLFDVLDGELARLQGTANSRGMLYDATTDRIKEVLLYSGIAYFLSTGANAEWAFAAVVACGASITVSYAKAKGEAALALKRHLSDHHALNRHFKEGLVPFEIRMAMVVIGLLTGRILEATVLVAILATITIFTRLSVIGKQL